MKNNLFEEENRRSENQACHFFIKLWTIVEDNVTFKASSQADPGIIKEGKKTSTLIFIILLMSTVGMAE